MDMENMDMVTAMATVMVMNLRRKNPMRKIKWKQTLLPEAMLPLPEKESITSHPIPCNSCG